MATLNDLKREFYIKSLDGTLASGPNSGVLGIDEGSSISVDSTDPAFPVLSINPEAVQLLIDLAGAAFGEEVGLTTADSPYAADVYDSLTVSLIGGDVTVNFPAGTSTRNVIKLEQVVPSLPNQLTLSSADGFEMLRADGTIVSDNNIVLDQNIQIEFRWSGGTWRFNI